jgi:hypothetical protein
MVFTLVCSNHLQVPWDLGHACLRLQVGSRSVPLHVMHVAPAHHHRNHYITVRCWSTSVVNARRISENDGIFGASSVILCVPSQYRSSSHAPSAPPCSCRSWLPDLWGVLVVHSYNQISNMPWNLTMWSYKKFFSYEYVVRQGLPPNLPWSLYAV